MLRRDLLRKGLLPNPPPNLFVKDPLPTPLVWGWKGIFCEKVLKGVWGRTFPQKVSPGYSKNHKKARKTEDSRENVGKIGCDQLSLTFFDFDLL